MPKYLLDANLPYYFSLWNSPEFIHVNDLPGIKTDEEIWIYAKKNQLTIISKDADFSLKVLQRGTPPKLIHKRFGNLKLAEFHRALNQAWQQINREIDQASMINVYIDSLEIVR